MRTTFNPFTGKLDYIGTAGSSSTSIFASYSATNVTTTITFDATNTSIDELANVLGTLIQLLKSGSLPFDPTNTSLDEVATALSSLISFLSTGIARTNGFTVLNVTTDRTIDGSSSDIDDLANVIGSLIQSLVAGTSTDVYTTFNIITKTTFDATNTSIDELADVLGSVIRTLQGAGVIQ